VKRKFTNYSVATTSNRKRASADHSIRIVTRHDPFQPDHIILDTLQRGYRRGDEIFRPAKVVVNDLSNPESGSLYKVIRVPTDFSERCKISCFS
jgi:hypothetical protein